MQQATIPDIKFQLADGRMCDLQADMERLMWDAHHPRIQSFLNRCAMRYGCSTFFLTTAPRKVLNRLAIFVNVYWQCQQLLSMLGINWNDKALLAIISQHGNSAQIPLDGWLQILAHLHNRWLESDIAF